MEYLFIAGPDTDTGKNNMTIDEKLMGISEAEGLTILRFYHWDPVCISLGRGQDPNIILDRDYLNDNDIDHVSRITGGSFVLHKGDITYSIITSNKSRLFALSLFEFFEKVHRGFYKALINSGINPELLSFGQGRFRREDKMHPCFSNSSNYEILIEGKKVLGSAQKRNRNSLLQHGSLLIEDSLEELFNVQTIYDDYSYIENKVTFLRKYIDSDYGKLYSAISRAIAEVLELKLEKLDIYRLIDNSCSV